MQKEWYLIYTKPKCEKRVASLLTKRKIENFYPINCRQIKEYRKNKVVYEPLFDSYVFAKIEAGNISLLKQFDSVISLVYWKSEPVIIKEEEIEAIKEFTTYHQNIKLEKTPMNQNSESGFTDKPSYSMDGNMLMIKNKFRKVNLPSLGFVMIAEMEERGVMGREMEIKKNLLAMQ
jgi:transcription antitermination factor NusG